MNPNSAQLWLVRTSGGEILGPFPQSELQNQFVRGTFTTYDEIAPPNTPWMCADILISSTEELTHTATRTSLTPATRSLNANTAPKLELPTEEVPRPALKEKTPPYPVGIGIRIAPFLLGSMLVLGIWLMFVQSKTREPRTETSAFGSQTQTEFMKTIYGLIARGETPAAIGILQQHNKSLQPSDYPEYIVALAAALISLDQNNADAKRLLSQILSKEGTASQTKSAAHRWLGYQMLAKDEGDMGENHLLESLQLDPKNAAARFNLGRAYLKQERFIQALDYFQLAELEFPGLWLIHIYKGRARSELGQFQQAQSSFQTAIELEPDRWLSYIYYALFLASRQETEAAQRVLKTMLTRDPQFEQLSPPPWGYFQEKIHFSEYLSVFSHISNGLPSEERALGRVLIEYAGSPTPESIAKLQPFTRSGNISAQLALLRTLLLKNEHEVLSKLVDKLQGDLREFGAMAYALRGQAFAKLDRNRDAENDFKFALSLDPANAQAHWAYAQFLGNSGRKMEMVSRLKTLINFHPGYIPAIVANLNN